jgi:hypothetical protein
MWEISWSAEEILASEERICSMGLDFPLCVIFNMEFIHLRCLM